MDYKRSKKKVVTDIRLKGLFPTIKSSFHIHFLEGHLIVVSHYKLWKGPRITFKIDKNNYLIVFHRGNAFSFFKNNQQFASLVSESLILKKHRVFKLTHDHDVGLLLLTIMSLLVLILRGDEINDSSDFTIDFGYLGPEMLEMDTEWVPK